MCTRRVVVSWPLVVVLGLAFTGVASAQTPFQASVTSIATLPSAKAGGCLSGAFYCGTANIAGYGAADWNAFLTGVTIVPTSCGTTYTATTEFTLGSDGSTFVGLDANG